MGFALAAGARLHYEEYGDGEPLVLLHGNSENLGYFANQIPVFAARYRVLALDTRAHGGSTRGAGPLDFARLSDDVCAVLDAVGVESAHVLGYSDGGNTALTLALRTPDRVRSLVVNGANLDPAGLGWTFRAPATLAWLAAGVIAPLSSPVRRRRDLLALMVRHPHIPADDLASITVPTLVIVGERDPIPRRHTELIARSIPDAELAVVPDAGHACAEQRPDVFNRAVLDFLTRVEARD